MAVKDITGMRIGSLTAEKFIEFKNRNSRWLWRCDCGGYITGTRVYVEHHKKYKDCGCSTSKSPTEVALRYRYGRLRRRHRDKGGTDSDFMTFDEYKELIHSDCVYCGAHPSIVVKDKPTNTKIVDMISSPDRIDNSRAYQRNNVVPSCTRCNISRGTMTPLEFLNHAASIVRYSRLDPYKE